MFPSKFLSSYCGLIVQDYVSMVSIWAFFTKLCLTKDTISQPEAHKQATMG